MDWLRRGLNERPREQGNNSQYLEKARSLMTRKVTLYYVVS
jgi:hypothetical protein